MELGIIKGSEVKQNLDGEKASRVLQVELSSGDDVQSVELYRLPGCDENPVNETRVLIIEIGTSKAAIAAADVAADDSLEPGEREIYSTDGSERLAKIRLKTDGSLVLNDGSDTAVKFSKLQEAFDQLKADHDDLVTFVNTHSHPTAPSGPTSPPTPATPPIVASTANIAPAESDTVKLP